MHKYVYFFERVKGSSLTFSHRRLFFFFFNSTAAGGALFPSPPVDLMAAVRAERAPVFVQPAVLTPTHRCQRYSVRRASCLQATAAPALLWLFTLPALTSALFPHRKRLSYPAANLRFIKRERKKRIYPSARFLLDSTGSMRAAKFGPYLSFFHRHQSVLGWIPAEEGFTSFLSTLL